MHEGGKCFANILPICPLLNMQANAPTPGDNSKHWPSAHSSHLADVRGDAINVGIDNFL